MIQAMLRLLCVIILYIILYMNSLYVNNLLNSLYVNNLLLVLILVEVPDMTELKYDNTYIILYIILILWT